MSIRATTSVRANFLSILQEKTYFFYFTLQLLQNTHISLSILHIYLIKYSFFLHFLLFPSFSSLSQSHHLVFSVHTHTQPATLQQNLAIDSPIFHNNNHNNNDNNNDSPIFHNNNHNNDTITITTQWFTDLPQQRHNHNHNNSNPLALHVWSILHHRLHFQTDCLIGEADRCSQLTRRPNSPIGLSSWRVRS